MSKASTSKLGILKAYLWILGIFVLFWWPLSHWFCAEWYHRLMGFEDFDPSLVTIIGTTGLLVAMNIFVVAMDPVRNRAILAVLITFSIAMAGTYFFLIQAREFPAREYFNITLLIVNAVILAALCPPVASFPARDASNVPPHSNSRFRTDDNKNGGV
jgi:hypothetical protein